MPKFNFKPRKERGPKDAKHSSVTLHNIPSLPNELWIPILTLAMKLPLILDPYCLSSSMEQFYSTITDPYSSARDQLECKRANKTRQSLSLVCRRFRALVNNIHTTNWLYIADNEPRNYNAPKLRWTDDNEGEADSQLCTRLDLRLSFEHTHRLLVQSKRPIHTYRLFVQRTVSERGVTAEFHSFEDLLPSLAALKVVHLGLAYCSPYRRAAAVRDPLSHVIIEGMLGGLTTLSLVMSANETRDIIYQPLHLPCLRVLFLEFPVFGVREDGLRQWQFESLRILSLHTMERSRNVEPVPTISPVVACFLRRHSLQIHGLRLQPGPWAFPYKSESVIPIPGHDQEELWGALSTLSSLSTDFRHFHEHFGAERVADSSIRHLFSQLRTMGQCGPATVGSFVNGLQAALETASSCLETVIIPNQNGPLVLGPKESWPTDDLVAVDTLNALCKQIHVNLVIRDGER